MCGKFSDSPWIIKKVPHFLSLHPTGQPPDSAISNSRICHAFYDVGLSGYRNQIHQFQYVLRVLFWGAFSTRVYGTPCFFPYTESMCQLPPLTCGNRTLCTDIFPGIPLRRLLNPHPTSGVLSGAVLKGKWWSAFFFGACRVSFRLVTTQLQKYISRIDFRKEKNRGREEKCPRACM